MKNIHSITDRTEELKGECVFNACLYVIDLFSWKQKMLY